MYRSSWQRRMAFEHVLVYSKRSDKKLRILTKKMQSCNKKSVCFRWKLMIIKRERMMQRVWTIRFSKLFKIIKIKIRSIERSNRSSRNLKDGKMKPKGWANSLRACWKGVQKNILTWMKSWSKQTMNSKREIFNLPKCNMKRSSLRKNLKCRCKNPKTILKENLKNLN